MATENTLNIRARNNALKARAKNGPQDSYATEKMNRFAKIKGHTTVLTTEDRLR